MSDTPTEPTPEPPVDEVAEGDATMDVAGMGHEPEDEDS